MDESLQSMKLDLWNLELHEQEDLIVVMAAIEEAELGNLSNQQNKKPADAGFLFTP